MLDHFPTANVVPKLLTQEISQKSTKRKTDKKRLDNMQFTKTVSTKILS